jgi:predicted DNA-binding transcriptional regulator AlpA
MKEAKLVDIDYMVTLLHKTKRTLEVDVTRRPESLPPRLIIPGSRKVLWLESDVLAWLEKCRTV